MSHLDEVVKQVDAAIVAGGIAPMNELLIALSNDGELARDARAEQQQRLRVAISHHHRQPKDDAARRAHLTRSGTIL